MSIIFLFIMFAGIIGSGAMVATVAYLLNRIRQLESGTSGDAGSHQLVEQVNRLREELLTVQEEMSSLSERVDFTDKLLLSGADDDKPSDSE